MNVNPAKPTPVYKEAPLKKRLMDDFGKHKYKYLLILPIIIYLLLFCYKPMYGLVIAFKNYRPTRGIMGSKWVGFMWFETFFKDPYFWRLLRNTFSISGLSILFGFPAPILLALLLNEVHNDKFKRTVQTITYMPYFISLVVTCSLLKIYTMENGLFPAIMEFFGGTRQNLLAAPKYFYPIYILSDIWQGIGWNSIIYMSALSSIDQQLYEAARIDGCGRLRQAWHVTLPGIVPTIIVLLILSMGSLLSVSSDKILLLYTPLTYETGDVFGTYTYRLGIRGGKYDFTAAVGLAETVVNFLMVIFFNWVSKKTTEQSLW